MRKDYTGQRFANLVILRHVKRPSHVKSIKTYYLCQCDCGKQKVIAISNLVSGHVRSCGCLKKTLTPPTKTTHGMSHTSIYRRYYSMMQRCHNPSNPHYKNYGARGITVCRKWKDSFLAFHDYVSKLSHYNEKGYTLDRIDNNGNYKPGNVRWATRSQQAKNQRPRTKHVR